MKKDKKGGRFSDVGTLVASQQQAVVISISMTVLLNLNLHIFSFFKTSIN